MKSEKKCKNRSEISVLITDTTPAYLAFGGKAVLAAMLKEFISKQGMRVEFDKWWDPTQNPDIVQFFSITERDTVQRAKARGIKVVLMLLMDHVTSRSRLHLAYLKARNSMFRMICPAIAKKIFYWNEINDFDAIVFLHQGDCMAAQFLYGARKELCHVIPHGCDALRLEPALCKPELDLPEKYLVSVGTICQRKNSVYLAEMASKAKVPVVFLGGKASSEDPYFNRFQQFVDNKYVFYSGFVSNEQKDVILRNASGFVLMSLGESGCIAAYEAASYGLPLLLSDLNWAKYYDSPVDIHYCPPDDVDRAARKLVEFFEKSDRRLFPTFGLLTWNEVGEKYAKLYESLLV